MCRVAEMDGKMRGFGAGKSLIEAIRKEAEKKS
jgi:hypothetical protein